MGLVIVALWPFIGITKEICIHIIEALEMRYDNNIECLFQSKDQG